MRSGRSNHRAVLCAACCARHVWHVQCVRALIARARGCKKRGRPKMQRNPKKVAQGVQAHLGSTLSPLRTDHIGPWRLLLLCVRAEHAALSITRERTHKHSPSLLTPSSEDRLSNATARPASGVLWSPPLVLPAARDARCRLYRMTPAACSSALSASGGHGASVQAEKGTPVLA